MWLAATGRALLTIGRLLQTAQPWLQQQLQACNMAQGMSGDTLALVPVLYRPLMAVDWLRDQLADMQQHSTSAAAGRVSTMLLQELAKLVATYMPRVDALGGLCKTAITLGGIPFLADPAAQATVFQAYPQACAEGWLPQALQQLGSKVWAAWPQKCACNDDLCLNLDCLTEHACGGLRCSRCKVRVAWVAQPRHMRSLQL
jgi:hypothetical protein